MKTRIFLSLMLVICYCLSGMANPNINTNYASKISLRDIHIRISTKKISDKNIHQAHNKSIWSNNLAFAKELVDKMKTYFADENIVYAEYFIDKDPGFGKGTSILITASASISNHSFSIALPTSISDGFHFITIRYKDALGRWSVSAVRPFFKDKIEQSSTTLPNVVSAEYFIDKDPGFGKGTSIAITSGTNINNHNFAIVLPASISDGFHFITIRYKDALGNWSVSAVRPFFKDKIEQSSSTLPNIVSAEYFIDKDPGFGKGKSLTIKSGQTIDNFNFEVNLNALGLSKGTHFLHLRAKDANGVWGTVGTKTFVLSNEIVKITSLPSVYCTLNKIDIPYTIEGVFGSDNVFTAELSDTSGLFQESPIQLGSLTSTKNGMIRVDLPADLTGNNYKVRIVSTNPVRISDPKSLILKPTLPTVSVSNNLICQGASAILSATGCSGTVTWTGGLTGSSVTVTPTKSSNYKALCTLNTCKSDSSVAVTITVLPKPTQPKNTVSNASICVGSSSVLTASACTGGTLTWTGGLTGSSVTVSPTKTTSYKTLCTIAGCKSDSSLATTVTVISKPAQPKITASNASICLGSSSVLTATACTGGTLTWTGGLTGNSITVSPTKTTAYKALCTIAGCKSDSSLVTTVTVISKPTQPKITASNSSICLGSSSELTATACTGGTLTWTGGLTGISITVSPTQTTAYKALCTIAGCKSDSSLATTVTVISKPTQPKITASNANICVGNSSTLTASACTGGTLTWTGGLTGSSVTVSPTKTTAYKVLCTIAGCKSDSSLATTVTVISKPTQPKITTSNANICLGSSSTLTATACTGGTLTWTGGLTGNSITVSPTKTRAYKVLCTIAGCKSDSSLATTVTVISKPAQPKITASNASICVGRSSTLTATACTGGTLSWTGGLTGSSVTVTPTKTTAYKALCSIAGCKSDSSLVTTVTVISKPTQPKITASNASICLGSNSVLTATACTGGTLSWTGGLTGSSITVSPTKTTSYKTLCTIAGCKSDSSLVTTVTVISKPTQPKITASNASICLGSSSVLTATACTGGTLTWTGGLTGNSITVSPTKTTAYKALCTIAGCKSDSSLVTTVTVISKPTQPKITASNASICLGSSSVLTATACAGGTLTWTGGLTGSSITVSPTKTTSYKTLCTIAGCKSDSSLVTTVTVIAKPTQPKITASNANICLGSSSVLTATACTGGTLTWTGGLTGNSITVSPTKTTSYKALCNIAGCKSDSSLATTVTVIAKPTQPKITASNSSICSGISSTLTATACTGGTLTWTGGLTGNSITVSPTKTTSYKTLCTIAGCKSDSSLATMVTVISKPTQPKITASNANICLGSNSVLTATACTGGTLTWTGGLTGSSITVSPTVSKSYKVICTQSGCASDSSVATTITVLPKPTQPKITASNASICVGSNSVLTATACTGGTLTWTGGLTGNSITVSPTKTTSYKTLCTMAGCKSDSNLATTVTVIAKPTQPKITPSNSSICSGISSTLTATACTGGTLTWTGGLTGASITVSPTKTIVYKVLCTQNGCASDSSVATTITVLPKPVQPKITVSNANICVGGSSVLTATACTGGTLTWTGGLTGSSITVSPTKTTAYKVICTIAGCKSDSSLATTITVISKPTQPKITSINTSICVGSSSVLTATACTGGTLSWTGGLTGNSITVSPTKTIAYKVLCTIAGCKSDSSLATTVTVISKPTQPKITASNANICLGSNSVLTATACTGGILSWTGGLTGSSITVSPTKTTSYKALCTIAGCKSDSSLATTITVISKPVQPKITASNASICTGSNSVLTATACTGGTLTWTGGLTGSSITVSPTKTTSYKTLCTIAGCKSDSSLVTTVTVIAKPTQPKITASNANICLGSSSVLTATACTGGTLTWTGGLTGSSVTVSPTKTTSYKALCNIAGCKSDSSLATTVTVITKPTQPKITSSNSSICSGISSTLTATACTGGTLTWTGGLTGNSITVSPTKTTSYKTLCTIAGCKSDSSLATMVTVISKPTQPKITASNANICLGSSSVLTATACTGGTLTWTGGLTGNSITVSPPKTTSYKALCTIAGCKSDSSVATMVTVISKPTQPKITVSNASICLGNSSVLTATACTGGTLTWTGGLTGNSITVSPTKTTAYKVLCTIDGCKSDSSLATTIIVISKPTQPKITVSNASICVGSSSVLTASACTGGTLTWTGGLTGNSITVSPTKTTAYKALCTIAGCKSDSSLATTITVIAKPVQPKITASNANICLGSSSVLIVTACTGGTLTWTGGLTGNSIMVSPTKTTAYKVLCTIVGCKSDSSLATTITVIAKPTQPKITASNASICLGSSSVLTATACTGGTLTWTSGLTGNSITVSPTKTTAYKVLCTIAGCKSDSSLATTVVVTAKPNTPLITSSNNSCPSPILTKWNKSLGGNFSDELRIIVPTSDGGYLLGGASNSGIKGDKSEANRGNDFVKDYWVVKINSSGTKVWDKTLGGAYDDNLSSIVPTSDGGFLLGGTSSSGISGDKSEANKGTINVHNDFWIVKINANGTKMWDKTLGGAHDDNLSSIVNISDGGYLLVGSSNSSISGDRTESKKGSYDYWVVKINSSGTKVWDRAFGGDNNNYPTSAISTVDGGYLIGGYSSSNKSGDKSEASRGDFDYWLVKINSNGTKIWDKTLGGNGDDRLTEIVASSDGNYLVGGYTYSIGISGDKSEANKGDSDYWVVKINNSDGSKVWDKTLGGNKSERLRSIVITSDGGFLLGGTSYSGINGDKSEDSRGSGYSDYWIVKVNINGTKQWDKTLGGSIDDVLTTIILTSDNQYLVGGYSFSGISPDKSDANKGRSDFWLIKMQICIPTTTTTTLTATGCTGTVTWSNGATTNSITVSPSTATTYTATCTVNGCVSTPSNTIKVNPDLTTTSTSSMYEAARLDANSSKSDARIEFKVFPNPATDELNVETDLDGEATFQLYNIIGQQVLESTFVKRTKIPLINLSKGSYYYLIQYQEYRKTGKVLLE